MSPRDDEFPVSHPNLSEKDATTERGDDGRKDVPAEVPDPPTDYPDTGTVPDGAWGDKLDRWMKELDPDRRKPPREKILPYLLIRTVVPGDRGARPLPGGTIWWESPDILLIEASYTGAFDPARVVLAPTAGRAYRVFVRVWNLGMMPAISVHVAVWAINPGFAGAGNMNDPYYAQNRVGAAVIPRIEDRTRPGRMVIAEMGTTWTVPDDGVGHFCLIASCRCVADPFDGPLFATAHRHVAQRNVNAVGGGENMGPLLGRLASLVPRGFSLEVVHAGDDVVPLVKAARAPGARVISPGDLRVGETVSAAVLRDGTRLAAGAHIATAVNDVKVGSLVVATATLAGAAPTVSAQRIARSAVAAPIHTGVPLAARPGRVPLGATLRSPGATRLAIGELTDAAKADVSLVSADQPLAETFAAAFQHLIGARSLTARDVKAALGGPADAEHLLRFTLTDTAGAVIGGYSLVVE